VRWVGFVRNVMLGREGVTREVLLSSLHDAGAVEARSHLTTGNVTFEVGDVPADVIAVRLEEAVSRVLGRPEIVALRPLDRLRDLVAGDWFSGFDPTSWELEVGFLRHDAPALDASLLPDPRRTVLVRVQERELFTARPRSGGGRPHVNTLLERATGARATARGWSTLKRIAEKG